ncbi:hypothetical protein Q0A17_03015 [Citrobacter sp. S2-9]|uniref:Uncharacterized protein n=1 Tax=Citrobacter enshiensis TaxID=2971264 RepID=A0ABT8PQ61_9ENTR|nr:hypothetical protein [Citrobacter enshiensis]MDN8598389.1 hypothetical protein [Citrobacter enshiensis]
MSNPTAVTEVAWTLKDTLSAFGIAASLFFSIIATVISIKSFKNTRKRDLNAFGDSEFRIFEGIAKAEEDFTQFNIKILEDQIAYEGNQINNGKKFIMSIAQQQLFNVRACSVLNAYDIACQRYLDEKLDQPRFAKTYRARLSDVCSNSTYKKIIFEEGHRFSALQKVNDLLNDPERR